MSKFNQEKRVFDRLKSDCSEDAKYEYEYVLSILIERYNTTIYENRFIVGGTVEVFTYALLKSVGIECSLYGSQAKSGDIILPNNKKLSVKGTFTGKISDVKLVNQLGGGKRYWDTATLFIISGTGIVYGTPEMVEEEYIKQVSDGVVLKGKALREISQNPNNVFEVDIVPKPPTEMTGFSHKASVAVAKQIMFENKATTLIKSMDLD